jgi:hypothetical protein
MRAERYPREAITEELLGEVFSMRPCRSVISRTSLEFSEVRQSPASKDMNTEVDGSTALEAITRQRLVKTQQNETFFNSYSGGG